MNKLKIHFLNTIWSDAIILEVNQKYGFVDTGSTFYYPMIEKHLEEYNSKMSAFQEKINKGNFTNNNVFVAWDKESLNPFSISNKIYFSFKGFR